MMSDEMKTHLLGNNQVERITVDKASYSSHGDHSLTLKTISVHKFKKEAWSGDANMVNFASEAREGQETEGILQVDAVTDSILRFRFAHGDAVTENKTPMVVGSFDGPTKFNVATYADRVELRTASATAIFFLDPYRVEVRGADGLKICGISGPEKNQFCMWDSINTGINRTLDGKTALATECFDLDHDECIYGLGEKFRQLNKRGQMIDLINEDGLGTMTHRTYKNIPFFVSNKGYGVFFNHHTLMTFWVGAQNGADNWVGMEEDFLDYYVILGDIKSVLSQYTDITGKGVMPPDWTFGFWQSKFTYHSAEETLDIIRKMREFEIPCDVMHLDTDWFWRDWHCDLKFDPVDFPDPAAYFKEMADMGVNVSLWHMPYIRKPSDLYSELEACGGFVKDQEGGILNFETCGEGEQMVGVIDFSNPEAVAIYKKYIKEVLELGARCMKTDFGEGVPLDGIYHGSDAVHYRNLYAFEYNKAAFEVTQEVFGEDQGVVWARSGWAGSQRYPLHWGGDIAANHHAFGPELCGALSFGLSGCQFWSHDIGGFLGENPDMELYVRWYQFGMFNSHSRTHGCGDREIYKLDEYTMNQCRELIRMRYSMMPYIIGSSRECVRDSLPMMLPLVAEYQDDPSTWNLATEYLFGKHLLYAPVLNLEHRCTFYLPDGKWTDWFSGEVLDGRQWVTRKEIPLEKFPLFLREGAVIPMHEWTNYVNERKIEQLSIKVAPFRSCDGKTVFEAPVNGEIITIVYQAKDGDHTVTVSGGTDMAIELDVTDGRKIELKH